MTLRTLSLFGLGIVSVTLSDARPALALSEVTAYGVSSFGGTGQCGTTDLSHSAHVKSAAAFSSMFSTLRIFGMWDTVTSANNTSARGSYFTDSTKGGSCMCSADDVSTTAGSDAADVIYIHTHGNHDATSSGLMMGNSGYDCEARTNQNMLFGNPKGSGDLEIAVIKACQSGDYDVWKGGNYRKQLVTTDSTFTMWNAFHGDSSCGSHVTDYVGTYSNHSILDGAGENWIDLAYDNDSGSDTDDCPVSIVFGSSTSARVSMYANGGWLDRKNTGTKSASTIFYISGCDPSNGRVLP